MAANARTYEHRAGDTTTVLGGEGLWYVPDVLAPGFDAPRAHPVRLGPYELCAKLADGGMATVHVARTLEGSSAGEVVAIKTIREELARSREFVAMFMDEARIVAGLRHPNVLRCFELGRAGGRAFIAMELLLGQSLWGAWEACRVRGVRLRYATIAWSCGG